MSTKRTSAESGNDEQKNEASDPLFQQEDNAKRAKTSPLSDTTLSDLPMEMLECILIKVVVMEVKGMKLAKSVWKEKADLVISRLRTVCSQWSYVLTTDFFRNELHRTLDNAAHEIVRLEILHESLGHSSMRGMTAMKDEIFLLQKLGDQDYIINVYNRDNMVDVKDVIPLPGMDPAYMTMAACNVFNCVYVAHRSKNCNCFKKDETLDNHHRCISVSRIKRDEEHQFRITPWSNAHQLPMGQISVSANGSLIILSAHQERDCNVISIYSANGFLQHEIMLSPEIDDYLTEVIPKSNGNLVLITLDVETIQRQLIEIDTSANIIRQYISSSTSDSMVNFADIHGRILISDLHIGNELIDSEFNLLDFASPPEDEVRCRMKFPFFTDMHYNSERNEVLCSSDGGLTIFRLTDQ